MAFQICSEGLMSLAGDPGRLSQQTFVQDWLRLGLSSVLLLMLSSRLRTWLTFLHGREMGSAVKLRQGQLQQWATLALLRTSD